MPIWYLKRPGRHEDRGTGLGIFFGGPELPKKSSERKKLANGQDTAAAAALTGSSCHPPVQILPINIVPGTPFLLTQSVLTDAPSPLRSLRFFTAFLHLA
ncbi:hypothetical protein JCGZ_25685 [Jatropha curcas]|uniref:Uncharacterized protein n=1 Tax=Jatropha curcas TaxID=180498 RepID=A0A067LFC4_JATCU|nr:hypothetical protein JCGZ_25685 [Jatropha curcas]